MHAHYANVDMHARLLLGSTSTQVNGLILRNNYLHADTKYLHQGGKQNLHVGKKKNLLTLFPSSGCHLGTLSYSLYLDFTLNENDKKKIQEKKEVEMNRDTVATVT